MSHLVAFCRTAYSSPDPPEVVATTDDLCVLQGVSGALEAFPSFGTGFANRRGRIIFLVEWCQSLVPTPPILSGNGLHSTGCHTRFAQGLPVSIYDFAQRLQRRARAFG